jgi:hypothetical protein
VHRLQLNVYHDGVSGCVITVCESWLDTLATRRESESSLAALATMLEASVEAVLLCAAASATREIDAPPPDGERTKSLAIAFRTCQMLAT